MAIQSWADDKAKAVFEGGNPRGFPTTIVGAARRKLTQLNGALTVEDMREPPGNRLHALTGNRLGQWSVSINDQYRLCFVWGANGPEDVEITDYH